MKHPLHIVASCSDRKTLPVPHERQLRSLPMGHLGMRVHAWWQRLNRGVAEQRPVSAMYAGQHWSVVRDLPKFVRGQSARLWVSSAGYGLVAEDMNVRAYSATFASGALDSCASDVQGRTDWWAALSKLPLSDRQAPRLLTDLATESPKGTIVVIASPTYIQAMRDDLARAVRALANPERLIILSSRSDGLAKVPSNLVVIGASLLWRLGGASVSLHARVARTLFDQLDGPSLTVSRAREWVAEATANAPPFFRPQREVISDAKVLAFVGKAIKNDTGLSASVALRQLRSRGLACEQKRFGRLFRTIKDRHAS